ncbi:hypothetical protein NHX12_023438 [Muraenolepis orangiensis]|uniref:Uncharacterized protein n=1 Tax=Muraenolepis orangiensis TaxID=630683 RepID=A0A9Q0EK53_9TELE|nr:hypothetical protein NHX12_023438 [Muraenolepis orangiensis]
MIQTCRPWNLQVSMRTTDNGSDKNSSSALPIGLDGRFPWLGLNPHLPNLINDPLIRTIVKEKFLTLRNGHVTTGWMRDQTTDERDSTGTFK